MAYCLFIVYFCLFIVCSFIFLTYKRLLNEFLNHFKHKTITHIHLRLKHLTFIKSFVTMNYVNMVMFKIELLLNLN